MESVTLAMARFKNLRFRSAKLLCTPTGQIFFWLSLVMPHF